MLTLAGVDALTSHAHRAKGGDDQALDAFVNAAYDQVWRLCASLVDDDSADDLAQETFIRAVRALPQFRGDASARTWLFAIGRRACMDELRSRHRRRRGDALLASRTARVERVVADASEEPLVTDMIGYLEFDRRLAFVLTQVIGLTYEESAEVCACPTGTIRSRVARARQDLLDLLEASSAEPNQGNASFSSA